MYMNNFMYPLNLVGWWGSQVNVHAKALAGTVNTASLNLATVQGGSIEFDYDSEWLNSSAKPTIWNKVIMHLYVTGIEFGLKKRWRGSDASIVIGDSGMDASRCADELWHFLCVCTVVFLLEDQSRWLWHHKMTSQWSLILFWEGTIKGELTQTLGLASGFLDTDWLGLLTSHRTSTLAILVSLMEQTITRIICVFHLSMYMHPDLFGDLLVSMTLVVWC